MTKQQKVFLGIGVVAVAAIALFAFRPKASAPLAQNNGGGGATPLPGNCPAGQKPCPNNPKICVDPMVQYIVDPCADFGIKGMSLNSTDV